MKYVGCTLALLCIPVMLFAKWVAFPLTNHLSGLSFSILRYAGGNVHPTWLSHGAIAALLLLVAADAFRRENWKQIYYLGAGLLCLMFAGFLQTAFGQPRLLNELARESGWLNAADRFAPAYLPLNLGMEPTVGPSLLSISTVGDRLLSGWYFMALGWYVGLMAALALMVAGARNMLRSSRRRAATATVSGILILAIGFSARPLYGEYVLSAALEAQTGGRLNEAARLYREAMRIDAWNALSLELYERIGAIDATFGQTATFEYRIFSAGTMVEREQWLAALAEYEAIAATADGPLGATAAHQAVELWTGYGLQLYQDGAFGAAVAAWQRALIHQPSMWLAAFYLSRGYFAVGRYQEAISLADRCLERVSDPVFRGNLYGNLGDAHTRRGDFTQAHSTYFSSYYWDYVMNKRGLSGLVGP